MNSNERAKELYTRVFSILSPYTDYQQPDFNKATCLTPIEWLYTITSIALGTFLISFLKELGKKSAEQVVEYIRGLKNTKINEEAESIVVELFVSEVVTLVQAVNKDQMDRALQNACTNVQQALKEMNFPEEAIEEIIPELMRELSDELRK